MKTEEKQTKPKKTAKYPAVVELKKVSEELKRTNKKLDKIAHILDGMWRERMPD